jgi:hypothetical protein
MERDTEIEQIRRELAILRDRYALHRRSAAILRGFFMVLTPVAAIGALALAIALLMSGAIYGIFVVGVVLLFGVSAIRLVTWPALDRHCVVAAARHLQPVFLLSRPEAARPNAERCRVDRAADRRP